MTPPKASSAPAWEAVKPPPMKRGKEAEGIDEATLNALYELLQKEGTVTDGVVYDTRGKARAKADRYKKALKDAELAEDGAVKTRVWPEDEKDRDGKSRFALVLATE